MINSGRNGQEKSLSGTDPLLDYRKAVKEYEKELETLTRLSASQKAYWTMLASGVLLSLLLGYSVVLGLWQRQPVVTQYVGLVAVLVLSTAGGWLAWTNRPQIHDKDLIVRNLAHDKQTRAADLPLDSPSALRIYRESTLDLIAYYRIRATRNRRVHNSIQALIIVASALGSTATALTGEFPLLRWFAVVLTASVTIAAGLTAYFKFRERGHGLQTTADEIDRHYTAAQFKLDDFANDQTETERLERFARYVEKLKEEQRKRELQLEQSPENQEDR